jgi:hypothetical protein
MNDNFLESFSTSGLGAQANNLPRPPIAGEPTEVTRISQQKSMTTSYLDYYRCPEEFARFCVSEGLGERPGFFRLGNEITCFGRSAAPTTLASTGDLIDVLPLLETRGNQIVLPFDADEILENLLREKYLVTENSPSFTRKLIRKSYYAARPFLSIAVRKHMQRFHLRQRREIEFPAWPLDKTVDNLCAELMRYSVQANGNRRIPFVWFWPNEYQGCVIVTHDVEHEEGRAYCGDLMDLDDRYGIRSSFQVVPEGRYDVTETFLESIRARGFELNVHDLNHDGHLVDSHKLFQERAKKINDYSKKWRTEGFRTGGMYRNSEWSDAFQFGYDMSFPNAAHLEPQKGGCCTIMPYLIGKLVELPLTTTQDYSLFHILGKYSIDLWKEEVNSISSSHGLAAFIVHPDYVIDRRARMVYEDLLQYLSSFCVSANLWQPLPRDVAHWWRERSRMHIEPAGNTWKIVGPGSERARVAFAQIEGGRLTYHFEKATCQESIA